jgi:Sigma-70, region 4
MGAWNKDKLRGKVYKEVGYTQKIPQPHKKKPLPGVMNFQEIADALGLSLSRVRQLYYSGIKKCESYAVKKGLNLEPMLTQEYKKWR